MAYIHFDLEKIAAQLLAVVDDPEDYTEGQIQTAVEKWLQEFAASLEQDPGYFCFGPYRIMSPLEL